MPKYDEFVHLIKDYGQKILPIGARSKADGYIKVKKFWNNSGNFFGKENNVSSKEN